LTPTKACCGRQFECAAIALRLAAWQNPKNSNRNFKRERLAMSELTDREARVKKLAMRSWRRGMKEMDLILGPYSDTYLVAKSDAELDHYEVMMAQNDQDLYLWVTGAQEAPAEFVDLLREIGDIALKRLGRSV
jgi:antitoxin CptB